MYNILSTKKIHTIIEKYPNKRQQISFNEAKTMRQQLGCGIYLCMQLLRKTETVDEAITLYHNIMTESADIKHKKIKETKEPMTEENKNLLLLTDLSARLTYGVKAYVKNYSKLDRKYYEGVYTVKSTHPSLNTVLAYSDKGSVEVIVGYNDYDIKPYLFPMSSMTEEQKEEFDRLYTFDALIIEPQWELIDWLNKNHFDYRGLIEKGLALDATDKNIY